MDDAKKETGAGHSLPWFRVNTDVTDHPKIEALADALGDPNAGWYVIRLWSWVMRYAARGRLGDGAETALERACRWRGPSGGLVEALIATGLLTRDGKALEVNDWSEYQGAAVKKAEKDAERKRLARGRRGDGAGTARVQYETRRDETKKPPKPTKAPALKAPPDPRHAPLIAALCAAAPGYAFSGGRDAKAVKELLALGTDAEILLRWKRARASSGFPTVRSLPELASHLQPLRPRVQQR